MPAESSYSPQSSGGGPPFRILTVVTNIAGTPTAVQLEVLSISDSFGNTIDNFVDYNFQRRMIDELAGIRERLCMRDGVPFVPTNP